MDLTERRAGTSSSTGSRHPWEQARARFFRRLVAPYTHAPARWLDVGAGDAWLGVQLADDLAPGSTMTCWDVNYTDDDITQLSTEFPNVVFTAERPAGGADVVTLLDVIEHVDDDVGLLRSIVDDHLSADGVVIVSVPAYQSLFTQHDVALGHHRRYAPESCRTVLRRGGLRIDRDGGLFTSLLVPRALQAGIERVRRTRRTDDEIGVGGWTGGPRLTTALTGALDADAALSSWASARGVVMPGLSYWAQCRRADP